MLHYKCINVYLKCIFYSITTATVIPCLFIWSYRKKMYIFFIVRQGSFWKSSLTFWWWNSGADVCGQMLAMKGHMCRAAYLKWYWLVEMRPKSTGDELLSPSAANNNHFLDRVLIFHNIFNSLVFYKLHTLLINQENTWLNITKLWPQYRVFFSDSRKEKQ